MGCPNVAMILILLKSVYFYLTDTIQESSFTSKSEDDLRSNNRYKRSGIYSKPERTLYSRLKV